MKFALLGADSDSLPLADAAVAAGHEIAWQGDLGGAPAGARAWFTGGDDGEQWEDLFDPATADAIIVGAGPGGGDLRARQVQELVRLGRPLLVVHPLFDSVLTYFEVDMARGESGAVVQHYNPLASAADLDQASDWVRHGHPQSGAVEQVIATRWAADRSREKVLWHFARDVEMLDRVAGRLSRIGAHAGGGGEASYSALSIQLLGESGVPVRWNIEPPTGRRELRLTFVFREGRTTLVFDDAGRPEELIEQHGEVERRSKVRDYDGAGRAVRRFVEAVEAGRGEASTWPAALHAMELTDSIEISLRRGRMIDVHNQQLTEHLAFKGTMAAAGCGVLLVLVPLMFVAGLVAGQFNVPVAQFVPHALLVLLAAFLALQLLPKLLYSKPAAANDAHGDPRGGDSDGG